MAKEFEVGSQVIVIDSPDDPDWEGKVVTLISLDEDDERFPYHVEDEQEGETLWVRAVDSVAGSTAPTTYELVSRFMQGEINSNRVAKALPRGHGVIIQLNPSERVCSEDAYEGPYVVIWHSRCGKCQKWASSDSMMSGTNYRFSDSTALKLKGNIVRKCAGNWKAVQVDLPRHGLSDHMKAALSLDSDLYRGSTTDASINHSRLLEAINAGPLLVETIVPTAAVAAAANPQTGVFEMTQQTKVSAIVSRAKNATMTAATLQAGKALNAAAIKAAKAQAPMLLRGYLDHPVAPAVIAIGLVAGTEFVPAGPTRDKVAKAADLMLVAALSDGADKFLDIEGMIDKVFAGLPAEAKTLIEGV